MGLFDKLFSKKEAMPGEPEEEKITFDSPYGRFFYHASPKVGEYGFECDSEWVAANGEEPAEICLYIDSDTPETATADTTYPVLERYLSSRERTDFEVKRAAADYFVHKPDIVGRELSAEELIEGMDITWIGIYRNGDAAFSLDTDMDNADDVMLIIKADGSREIKYTDEYHENEYHDKL